MLYNYKLSYGITIDKLWCLCYYVIILSEMVDTVEIHGLNACKCLPQHITLSTEVPFNNLAKYGRYFAYLKLFAANM